MHSLLHTLLYCIILQVLSSCSVALPEDTRSPLPDYTIWQSLLQDHVDDLGMVDYTGVISDSTKLQNFLNKLGEHPPNTSWDDQDKLAYWINLYNAATIQLITKHYPIKSIKDIGSSIQIPFVNTPWQIEFIKVGDKTYDLDDIEHNIIRKHFDEPSIHFALVCAAKSCPKLRNEAYIGEKLDEQLTDQAQIFLKDSTKNEFAPDHITISKLFRWYGGDFKKHSTKIEFLNLYSPVKIEESATVDYMGYSWELNKQSL